MRMIGWAKALLVAAAALSPGRVATPATPTEGEDPLTRRLSSIESAFRQSDAERLGTSLPTRDRVRIHIEGLTDVQAFFGPDQARVVLDRVFSRVTTLHFAFSENPVRLTDARVAFARGRWSWRHRASRLQTTQTLAFTLHRERMVWHVIEIRSHR